MAHDTEDQSSKDDESSKRIIFAHVPKKSYQLNISGRDIEILKGILIRIPWFCAALLGEALRTDRCKVPS